VLKHRWIIYIAGMIIIAAVCGGIIAARQNFAITDIYAYPNPFDNENEVTTIKTTVEAAGTAAGTMTILVYDINGEAVWAQEINVSVIQGTNELELSWGGENDFGREVANGLYICRVILELGGTHIVSCRILVK